MKFKIIEEEYLPMGHFSYVTIGTELGKFTGMTMISVDALLDREYPSRDFGLKIAKSKAIMRYIKEKIKNTKIQLSSLYILQKDLTKMKKFNNNSIEYKQILHSIQERENKIKRYKREYEIVHQKMLIEIRQRDQKLLALIPECENINIKKYLKE